MQRYTEGQYTNWQKISLPKNFSLERTLTCGQTFRITERSGTFLYVRGQSVIALRTENGELLFSVYGEEISKEKLKEILGINDDIEKINKELIKRVPQFAKVIDNTLGIRIMRQNPFETAISFIFSVQSAIPLIHRRLNTLAKIAGKEIETPFGTFNLFPTSSALRNLSKEEIKSLKLGFREKWFEEFAETYDEKKMNAIAKLPFEEKEKALLKIKGVGIKVAHCIMLFSMNELSAFPVDVWIKRGMEKLFGIKGTTRKITKEGRKLFGPFAGYAQEYIYFYMRR